MSRYPTITAAFVCALLAALPLHPAAAATSSKSKSATKKGATSTKKKPPTTGDPDAATDSGAAKKGSATPLDLPLPREVGDTGEKSHTEAGKSTDTGGKSKTSETAGSSAEKKSPSAAGKSTPKPESSDKPATDKSTTGAAAKPERPPNATIEPEAIAEFSSQPPRIQQLIRDALDLTRLNLTYTFGSADPDSGGMDCSGTIYYLLKAHRFDEVPRDSSGQYMWTRKSGAFFPVVSTSAESEEFKELLPGDLMFWTGTYNAARDIPITHVMLYLGKEKANGKRIMFGASDGRSYNGVQRWGVSVFDFKMPKADATTGEKAKVDFVGYARIPGLRGPVSSVAEQVASKGPDPEPATSAPATEGKAKTGAAAGGKSSTATTTAAKKKKGTSSKK